MSDIPLSRRVMLAGAAATAASPAMPSIATATTAPPSRLLSRIGTFAALRARRQGIEAGQTPATPAELDTFARAENQAFWDMRSAAHDVEGSDAWRAYRRYVESGLKPSRLPAGLKDAWTDRLGRPLDEAAARQPRPQPRPEGDVPTIP